MYRKFWLINALGNRYDLTNSSEKHFLNLPKGLGFVRAYASEQVGDSEILLSQQFKLTDVTGEIVFNADTNGAQYQDYQDFIQFIKYKPLELHYQTPNNIDDYFSSVLITQLEKSEINPEDSCLHAPIVFHRLTEWLTTKDHVITLTNQSGGDGKYYPLVRPYHYAGTTLSNTPITNYGTDNASFRITINGYCQNPQWTLTQNSKQYGVCKIDGTYDYVLVDSDEKQEQIYLEYEGSVISNPKQYQDFTVGDGYKTFIKLKVGESIFTFTCGNIDTFDGGITIVYKDSFTTV